MKNKFVALIFSLIVILVTPVLTGCAKHQVTKNDNATEQYCQPAAEVQTLVYESQEVTNCRDVYRQASNVYEVQQYSFVDDTAADEDGKAGNENLLLLISGIVSVTLLLISSIFGTKYNRVSNVLKAIMDALEDRKVTVAEIKEIIRAWKGGT